MLHISFSSLLALRQVRPGEGEAHEDLRDADHDIQAGGAPVEGVLSCEGAGRVDVQSVGQSLEAEVQRDGMEVLMEEVRGMLDVLEEVHHGIQEVERVMEVPAEVLKSHADLGVEVLAPEVHVVQVRGVHVGTEVRGNQVVRGSPEIHELQVRGLHGSPEILVDHDVLEVRAD